jgi:murein DD-endopeptidase MepM/ murein hydrolase activator NlpD
VIRRLPPPVALLFGAFVLLLGPATGATAPVANVATSQAFGVRVIVPGQAVFTEGYVAAPADSVGTDGGIAYPSGAPVVTSGAITLSASAVASPTALATASAQVTGLSLFAGELTVERIDAKVTARADETSGTGDFTGTAVSGLGGTALSGGLLGDWGTVAVSSGTGASTTASDARGWYGSVTALDIRLTADHGGLPAGTEIQVGYATANVRAAVAPEPDVQDNEPDPSQEPFNAKSGSALQSAPRRARSEGPVEPPPPSKEPPISAIPNVHPKLTAGRYVFPVYGPAFYGDTFGAARADVSWHHGDDIFAPLGAPVLAVADGTVFSVGWNKIGGWRFWLRDRQGNEFYYAHLSAYSPFARNHAQVRAGTVIGFVGNTGDAEGTPYHLHFEIHPVALLSLGYDGAVNPTPYLDAWRRLQDIQFSASGAWLPGLVRLTASRAPEPGAILLKVSDISSASGLDPGSLRRALAPATSPTDVALAGGGYHDRPASANVPDLGRG